MVICPFCEYDLHLEVENAVQNHSEPDWYDELDCPKCGKQVEIETEVMIDITVTTPPPIKLKLPIIRGYMINVDPITVPPSYSGGFDAGYHAALDEIMRYNKNVSLRFEIRT